MNELGDSHPGPSPLDQLVAPQVQTDLLPITIIAPPTTPDKSSHLDIEHTPGSVPIDSEELSHDLVNQGWRKYWSKTENRPYFWNKVSGESLWEIPLSNRFDLSTDPQNNEDVNFKIRSELNMLKEENLKLKSENIEIKAEIGTMQTKIDNLEAKVDELTRSLKFMVTKYNELEQRSLLSNVSEKPSTSTQQAQDDASIVSEEGSLTEVDPSKIPSQSCQLIPLQQPCGHPQR
ncbi:hypothetical protein HA402_001478 [Bradysia odoriphaga]|nr:hypothetical protein HA402_001478 [Bradysia odoriphaga]